MNDNEQLSQDSPVTYINWTQVPINEEQQFMEDCNEVALQLQKNPGFICFKINRETAEEYEDNWLIYTEWKSRNDLNYALLNPTFDSFLRTWQFENTEPQYDLIEQYDFLKESHKDNLWSKFVRSPAFLLVKKILLQEVSLGFLLVIAWLLGIMVAMAILILR
ncbi:MAG: hypothetical protein F6K47_01905 [Symploca sp. SIO2E6]|nr:hypothetical protein [Symploca sp. SIO2E6]